MVGCQTDQTANRFMSAQTNVLSCQQRVLAFKEKMATRPAVMWKDERNALVYMVVEKLAQNNATDEMSACDDAYIAMIRADSAKTAGISSIVKTGVGVGLGLVGVKILADGITELANPDGAVSGDVWNVSGSRVNSNSGNNGGNASSSGDGLGLSNTFSTGSGQATGGFEPRTTPVNGDVSEITTGSNSGENSGEGNPVEIQPVIMPVE